MSETIRALLREHIHDAGSQWNLGSFGVIAEFMRDPGEPVAIRDEPGLLSAATARGGIGFGHLEGVRPFASESATGASWSHRVSLCLPEAACAMTRRGALTELGPDAGALRAENRGAVLFDLGLGTLQADICIRTRDPALLGILRQQAGRPVFEPGNPVMGAIVAAGPHRVFVARFGRCEVYQPIPPAGGRSPEGPHTHVLPQLMRSGRTHAATEPVPDGYVPCAHLVPAHAVRDALGHTRPFDANALAGFEALLARFGAPALNAAKQHVRAAVIAGDDPAGFAVPGSRFERHAMRVALRQLAAAGTADIEDWLRVHDPREASAETEETEPYAH